MPPETDAQRTQRLAAALITAIQPFLQSGTPGVGALLPRYTGGTPGNVVVLTVSNGSNSWADATTASRGGVWAVIGADNLVYPLGAAVPMVAGRYPPDADLMVKTASAPGQPNMEPIPTPYPDDHNPSTTFTVFMPGRMSHDGLKLLTLASAAPIFVTAPVGELGEYDFTSTGNGLTLPDLSGAGNPLTISTVDGTAPVYTARGLSMSSNVTLTTAATIPATLTLIVAFRRANATSNHALFSSAGANGAVWQLGGNDMRIWGDASDASPAQSSAANPTATVNHVYAVTINGLTVTIYDNGALVDTKTLTKPITSTGLMKLFNGNGNPFTGEAMYARILGTALSATDHQAAYVRANGKISSRPA